MENYPDSFHTEPQGNGTTPPVDEPNQSGGLATASLVLGILSILLICCGFSWLLGALGIMLSLLSRGRAHMPGSAKVGLGLSISGLVLGTGITLFLTLGFFVSAEGQDFMDAVRYGYEEYDNPEDMEKYLYDYFYDYQDKVYDYETPDSTASPDRII